MIRFRLFVISGLELRICFVSFANFKALLSNFQVASVSVMLFACQTKVIFHEHQMVIPFIMSPYWSVFKFGYLH